MYKNAGRPAPLPADVQPPAPRCEWRSEYVSWDPPTTDRWQFHPAADTTAARSAQLERDVEDLKDLGALALLAGLVIFGLASWAYDSWSRRGRMPVAQNL